MIRSFMGKTPRIAESAFISEAAYIVGDVVIGENSSIWPGAVLRGDFGRITIGNNTAVEDNCIIHSGSIKAAVLDVNIGDSVNIGHGAAVHCRSIGNNVLIGMNATLLHDSEIGSYCLIGASCMVTQGMKVPDRSFVIGVPAKVKGEITSDQLHWLEKAPKDYAELCWKYKEEGL